MANLNSVTIIGRLTKDPQLSETKGSTSVTNFDVATNEYWGDNQSHTEFHRVTLWGKQATNACQFLHKGSQVLVQGSLRTDKWTDKDGQTRYTTKINGQQCQFLDSKPKAERVSDEGPPQEAPEEEAAAVAQVQKLTAARGAPVF